jgi:hypothetical protein
MVRSVTLAASPSWATRMSRYAQARSKRDRTKRPLPNSSIRPCVVTSVLVAVVFSALEAGRAAMSANPDWSRVLAQGGGLLALAVAVTALSVLTFRAYQKSV